MFDIFDENCLKVKSISKVPNKKNRKPESVERNRSQKPESEPESAEETAKMRKVKGMTKLKSVKKVKSIMDIDDDLALKMKKEVEEGDTPSSSEEKRLVYRESPGEVGPSSSEEEVISGEKTDGESETPGEVGPDVQAKIDRILKMFNASSLDDIIEVTPIKSIQEVDPDNLPIRHIPDDRGGQFCINSLFD